MISQDIDGGHFITKAEFEQPEVSDSTDSETPQE